MYEVVSVVLKVNFMKGEMKEYIPKAEMEKAYKIALAKLTHKKSI